MPITVPVAANYQNPVNALRVAWDREPSEGSRMIPVELDWLSMGGANGCIAINCSGQSPQNFSQIAALTVDNSGCSSDIQFIFTDSQQTYTVAAYAPTSTFPVFTNSTTFFVNYLSGAVAEVASDTTRFGVLNSMPPPVALPLSSEQQVASFNTLSVASGSQTLLASTMFGTVEGITVSHQFVSAACNVAWQIKDGTSKTLAGGQCAANANANTNNYVMSFNLTDLRLHFTGGLTFQQTITGSGTSSLAAINLYYRNP